MRAQVLTLFRRAPKPDWTREELAELYRIESALVQARFSVEVDRGLTDEGDPWFVFCRPDGEVLVNISRIDGEYILSSPGLRTPLHGNSFHSLSKSFVDQIPLHVPLDRNRSGAQIYLHPAATLSVLIGTIFIAWEDAYLTSGRSDSALARDEEAADHASLKSAFQALFQSSVDAILNGAREIAHMNQTAFLAIISTVAAFAVSSSLGFGPDLLSQASHHTADTMVPPTEPTKLADGGLLEDLKSDQSSVLRSKPLDQVYADKAIAQGATEADQSQPLPSAPQPNQSEAVIGLLESAGGQSHIVDLSAFLKITDADLQNAARSSVTGPEYVNLLVEQSSAAKGSAATAETPAGSQHVNLEQIFGTLKLEFANVMITPTDQSALTFFNGVHATNLTQLTPVNLQPNAGATFSPSSLSVDLPHWDDMAAAVVNQFLKDHPDAEAIIDHNTIIFYDGERGLDHSAPMTYQAWTSDSGTMIAIVGHADHPITATVA